MSQFDFNAEPMEAFNRRHDLQQQLTMEAILNGEDIFSSAEEDDEDEEVAGLRAFGRGGPR